jgi:TRAP-type C4-dicarboxylate transport system permease small subunit
MLRVINRVAWVFAMVGGLCASLVAVMIVVSIAGRSLASAPIQGDVELTQFGIAVCISLCLPWCQLHGANIIVDFFTQRASESAQRVLDGFGALLLAVMVGLLSWRTAAGARAVSDAGEQTMILGLPMWWTYALLAPGRELPSLVALIQVAMHYSGPDVKDMQA